MTSPTGSAMDVDHQDEPTALHQPILPPSASAEPVTVACSLPDTAMVVQTGLAMEERQHDLTPQEPCAQPDDPLLDVPLLDPVMRWLEDEEDPPLGLTHRRAKVRIHQTQLPRLWEIYGEDSSFPPNNAIRRSFRMMGFLAASIEPPLPRQTRAQRRAMSQRRGRARAVADSEPSHQGPTGQAKAQPHSQNQAEPRGRQRQPIPPSTRELRPRRPAGTVVEEWHHPSRLPGVRTGRQSHEQQQQRQQPRPQRQRGQKPSQHTSSPPADRRGRQ